MIKHLSKLYYTFKNKCLLYEPEVLSVFYFLPNEGNINWVNKSKAVSPSQVVSVLHGVAGVYKIL